jgi:hypothetical protein
VQLGAGIDEVPSITVIIIIIIIIIITCVLRFTLKLPVMRCLKISTPHA